MLTALNFFKEEARLWCMAQATKLQDLVVGCVEGLGHVEELCVASTILHRTFSCIIIIGDLSLM